MKFIEPSTVLAAPPGEQGANSFLDSSIGVALVGICGAIGIIIAVVCILRMVKHVTSGKPGEGFKVLLFGLVIAGLLFDLKITVKGTSQMAALVGKTFDSVGTVTGG